MMKSHPVFRAVTRAMLVAGAVLLLSAPADAGKAASTRRSSATRTAPRTQVTGQTVTRVRAGYAGRYYRPYSYGFRYGPWRYGYGVNAWPHVYAHGYYGYQAYPYGPRASQTSRQPYGAFDLDVRPRTTEIYIDGEYVGLARNFDGWPDVLWLEPGSYEVSFFRDGYETVTRRLTVSDRTVLDVRERLQKGESVRPQPPVEKARAGAAGANAEPGTVVIEREREPGAVLPYPRRSSGGDR